jgi:predicted protein tyrosine phosphatase
LEDQSNKRKIILGAKYFLKDKILNEVFEVKITQLNDIELTYENLDTKKEYYREIEEVELISIISEIEANRLNNQSVFSISDDLIKGIVGREEIIKYSENDFKELKKDKDTVIISITDPDKSSLSDDMLNKFKDSLSIQFWDIEKGNEVGNYIPISEEKGYIIKEFILKNKNNNFIVHCEAGISRSAGVGLAIYMLIRDNGDDYLFATSPNPITAHHRYHPNWSVFDAITKVKEKKKNNIKIFK